MSPSKYTQEKMSALYQKHGAFFAFVSPFGFFSNQNVMLTQHLFCLSRMCDTYARPTGRSPNGGTTRSSAQHRPHRRANLPPRAKGPRATQTRPRRGTTGSFGHDFRPTGERTIVESKTRQTGQSEGRRTDDTQRGKTRKTRKSLGKNAHRYAQHRLGKRHRRNKGWEHHV